MSCALGVRAEAQSRYSTGVGVFQLAIRFASATLAALALIGLWRRKRVRRLRMLPAHLTATIMVCTLESVNPGIYFTWDLWAVRELFLHALSLAIIAEVAWRAFSNLPRERRHVRLVLALALLIPLGLVALTPWNQHDLVGARWLFVLIVEVMPRLAYGAGFVGLALVWAMARKLVPPDPLHASVALGLAGYLFIYSVSLGLAGQHGPRVLAYTVAPMSYVLVLALWAWIAWRREPTPDAPLHVRQTLQPWRF